MADFILFGAHLHDDSESSPANSTPLLFKGVDALTDVDDESHDNYDTEFDAESDADESNEFDEAGDAESGGRPGLGLLVGLVLFVGIAAAVRYIRGGDDGPDESADLDDADDEERDEVGVDA